MTDLTLPFAAIGPTSQLTHPDPKNPLAIPTAFLIDLTDGNGTAIFALAKGGTAVRAQSDTIAVQAVAGAGGRAAKFSGPVEVDGKLQVTGDADISGNLSNTNVVGTLTANNPAGNAIVATSITQDTIQSHCDAQGHAAVSATNANASGFGVWAQCRGVAGLFNGAVQVNNPTDDDVDGFVSTSVTQGHAAVAGHNNGGGFAFWGASDSAGGTGIYARGAKQAAQFDGAVEVNGTLNVRDDIVLAAAADFAEEFDLAGTADAEPGTVMVLDGEGSVKPSCLAYDRKVAGIISGGGEYRPGIILDKRASHRPRKALALVGKVYCKVDANYAPIEIGDMLTTSPTSGHAMKAVDAVKAFGAVIGKALRPISAGEGQIPVLVTLQ